MFSHVMIGTRDLEQARHFYDAVLATLSVPPGRENTSPTGQRRLFYRHAGNTFGVTEPINGEPATVANGATIGFTCESEAQVQQFHDVAVAHGGQSIEAPPGWRESSLGALYLAYVRDPDGHKLCALYRRPAAP